jgi:hypothetical protein
MSLITKQIVIERTKEQIQKEVSANLVREIQGTYENLVRKYNDIMDRFWKHPKLTPQEVADSLGTDAVSLFNYGGALCTLIMSINPEEKRLMEPKNAFTINQDGTVSISNEPYEG